MVRDGALLSVSTRRQPITLLDAAFVLLADGVARDHRLQTARCARESARVCVRVRVWARTRAAFVHARVSVRARAEGARGERGTTGDACDLGIMH